MTSINGTKNLPEVKSPFTKKPKSKNINNIADIKVSENIKVHIVKEFIEPMYINDVKNTIKGKKCWKLTGQIFETMSKILVAIGGIISFSSGYYSNPTLGFVAGSVSTVSLAMLQFSSFSYGENKKQSSELNILLTKLDIDTIPELNRDVDKNDDSKTINTNNDEINSLKKIIEELKDEQNSTSSISDISQNDQKLIINSIIIENENQNQNQNQNQDQIVV
jgi:hypothetical protein